MPAEILEDKIGRVQRRREWRRFFLELLVLAGAVYVVLTFVIGIAVMEGDSMSPTLNEGDVLIYYRLDQSCHVEDIVVFQGEEDKVYVKRIAAVEGETLESEDIPEGGEAYVVPAGEVYVIGDNRESEGDSQKAGTVKKEQLIGRVLFYVGHTF